MKNKKTSQNSKGILLNLVFSNYFWKFPQERNISENQLASSFPKPVSKKKSGQGKISLDQKFKKKNLVPKKNRKVKTRKKKKKKSEIQSEPA